VHIRPWSTVIKVPTVTGDVWFKANGGATRYEPRLMVALSRWTTGRVLTPLAIDAARGWSLLPDGGPTLRSAGADLAEWTEMLGQYGELQRETVPLAGDLMAMASLTNVHRQCRACWLISSLGRTSWIGEADGLSAQTYAGCSLRFRSSPNGAPSWRRPESRRWFSMTISRRQCLRRQ
jgi:hypothetical protein